MTNLDFLNQEPMHYYLLDNATNRILHASTDPIEGGQYSEIPIVVGFDGEMVFQSELETKAYASKKAAWEEEQSKEELRERRESECFRIVDRAAWFYSLSDERKAEILAWRQAWCDVTDSMEVPQVPVWLESELSKQQ